MAGSARSDDSLLKPKMVLLRVVMVSVLNRDILLKGEGEYGWPPCTNTLRSALFLFEIFFTFLAEQETIMRTSTDLNCKIYLPF
jgi:hypothetical protein